MSKHALGNKALMTPGPLPIRQGPPPSSHKGWTSGMGHNSNTPPATRPDPLLSATFKLVGAEKNHSTAENGVRFYTLRYDFENTATGDTITCHNAVACHNTSQDIVPDEAVGKTFKIAVKAHDKNEPESPDKVPLSEKFVVGDVDGRTEKITFVYNN